MTDPNEAAGLDDRFASVDHPQSVKISGHSDRFQIRADEWNDNFGRIFATWGILNPNGPTLYTFGERSESEERQFFLRTHHLLGGNTIILKMEVKSELTYALINDAFLEILKFINDNGHTSPFGAIPSFVYANNDDQTLKEIMHRIIAEETRNFDWGRELYFTKEFGQNFFGRAGCELRAAYEINIRRPELTEEQKEFMEFTHMRYSHVPDYVDAITPDFVSSRITEELYQEWRTVIDGATRNRYALSIFIHMWDGALSLMNAILKENSVSSQELMQFLGMYKLNFPDE